MGTKAANDGDPEIALHCFLLPTHSSNSRLKTNLNVMTESVRLLQIERAAKNQESFLIKILNKWYSDNEYVVKCSEKDKYEIFYLRHRLILFLDVGNPCDTIKYL